MKNRIIWTALFAIFLLFAVVMSYKKNSAKIEKELVFTPKGIAERPVAKILKTDTRQEAGVRKKIAEIQAQPIVDVEIPAQISLEEIDAKVKKIDAEINREHYVERANRNELQVDGFLQFRKLLHYRNQLMERKVKIVLEST